jgi:PAS domain S-box-containing protein
VKHSALLRYGVATLAVALVVLLKLLLNPLITSQSPFLLLSVAVMVAAWFGGLGPGLLATALATLAADYFFLPPQGSFTGLEVVFLPLALFAVQGLVITPLTEALRSARQRAEASMLEAQSHQESLRRSEERFRLLVEGVEDYAIIMLDTEGSVVSWNAGAQRIEGYRAEEILGRHFSAFHTLEDVEHSHPEEKLREAISEGRYQEEGLRVRKDGSEFWASVLITALRDEEGNLRGFYKVVRDITERKEAEKQLRESEELYRSVVEQAAENIFLIDADTKRVIQANATLHHSLGYSTEELRELTLYDIVAHDHEDIERNLRKILEERRRSIGERQYRRKDGSVIDVEVNAGAISYGGREVVCVVAHDVTNRKMAEEALRRSLDRLLALFEAGRVLGSSLERDEIASKLLEITKRLSALDAAAIHLQDGRGKLSELRSLGMERMLSSVRERPEVHSALLEASEEGGVRSLQLGPVGPGAQRPAAAVFLPLRVRDRVIGVLEGYGPETIDEKESVQTLASLANQAASALENARLYEELAERERELHYLVGQIVVSQEDERRRVAYEIHDGLTQIAVTAYQRLELYKEDYSPDSARGQEEMKGIIELVRQTVAEARRVIADLRPTTLDDFGLAKAVQMQVADLRAEGYQADCKETLGEERLPATLETALFRVAQEALTNVRKHAQTDRVRIMLGRQNGLIELEVQDWGRGFEPTEVTNGGGPGERIGLSSMRERVALLGGALDIHSKPGVGTLVVAQVPTMGDDYGC